MTLTTTRPGPDGRDVTVITLPTTTAQAIAAAVAARDEGFAQAEAADRTGWDKALIDTAIDALADTGQPFSANELRELLPSDVRPALLGSRFQHAANNRDRIRFVGFERSTKRNTHGKPVARWIGVASA